MEVVKDIIKDIVKNIVKEVINILNVISHSHFEVILKYLYPSADIHDFHECCAAKNDCCVAENKSEPPNMEICDIVKQKYLSNVNNSYIPGSAHTRRTKEEDNYNIESAPANTLKCIMKYYLDQNIVNPTNKSDDINGKDKCDDINDKCDINGKDKPQLLNIKACDYMNRSPNDNSSYILDQETVNPINVSVNNYDTADNCGYVNFQNTDQYLNSHIVCYRIENDFKTDTVISDNCINNYVEAELEKNNVITDVTNNVTNVVTSITKKMFRDHSDNNICTWDLRLDTFKHNDVESTVLYDKSQSIDESQNDLPTLIYDDFRPYSDTCDLCPAHKTLNATYDDNLVDNLVEGLTHDHCYHNNNIQREISFYHINVCGLTSKMKNPVFTDHICDFDSSV